MLTSIADRERSNSTSEYDPLTQKQQKQETASAEDTVDEGVLQNLCETYVSNTQRRLDMHHKSLRDPHDCIYVIPAN